jgi:hypothetical protein
MAAIAATNHSEAVVGTPMPLSGRGPTRIATNAACNCVRACLQHCQIAIGINAANVRSEPHQHSIT